MLTKSLVSLALALSMFATPLALGQQSRPNNSWHSYSDSETVFIFVHGIFSNSQDCWTSPNGHYWPEILRTDTRFGKPSIFLGGYHTNFSSGLYRISDAANELLSFLRNPDVKNTPAPITKAGLVFIAHSTGGLVVRYLIERNQDLFRTKAVGLVLLASPSRGSGWSNRLKWLREIFGNKMAGQLARDNDFLVDLDSRFADLMGQRKLPNLVGVDAFENKFIVPGILGKSEYVVSAADSASYFGASVIVPNSDHFSIAKPTSTSHSSHQLLWDFFQNRYRPVSLAMTKVSYEKSQVTSLINILRERAEAIDASLNIAISRLNSLQKYPATEQLVTLKTRFLSLHEKHLAAINSGDVHLSHELIGEIYETLFRFRTIVESTVSTIRVQWYNEMVTRKYAFQENLDKDPEYITFRAVFQGLEQDTTLRTKTMSYPGEAPITLPSNLADLAFKLPDAKK